MQQFRGRDVLELCNPLLSQCDDEPYSNQATIRWNSVPLGSFGYRISAFAFMVAEAEATSIEKQNIFNVQA
jgi:hypothetical protein